MRKSGPIARNEREAYALLEGARTLRAARGARDELVEIRDAGFRDDDLEGPDYHEARVSVNGIAYVGAIEVDRRREDWRAHGHAGNPRYNDVVLHIPFDPRATVGYVRAASGRTIPSIPLGAFLPANAASAPIEDPSPLPDYFGTFDAEEKTDRLERLGATRFLRKRDRILERAKELLYRRDLPSPDGATQFQLPLDAFSNVGDLLASQDVRRQTLYEFIFEALGYPENASATRALARSVDYRYIRKIAGSSRRLDEALEATLFGASGLLPRHPSEERTRAIRERWDALSPAYRGTRLRQEDWRRFRARPANSPERRLAAGARLGAGIFLRLFAERTAATFDRAGNDRRRYATLRRMTVAETSRDAENVGRIGEGRADELLMNAILPFHAARFWAAGDETRLRRVFGAFASGRIRASNALVDRVAREAGLPEATRSALLYQGLLEAARFRTRAARRPALMVRDREISYCLKAS
jgi:hypothetical protein